MILFRDILLAEEDELDGVALAAKLTTAGYRVAVSYRAGSCCVGRAGSGWRIADCRSRPFCCCGVCYVKYHSVLTASLAALCCPSHCRLQVRQALGGGSGVAVFSNLRHSFLVVTAPDGTDFIVEVSSKGWGVVQLGKRAAMGGGGGGCMPRQQAAGTIGWHVGAQRLALSADHAFALAVLAMPMYGSRNVWTSAMPRISSCSAANAVPPLCASLGPTARLPAPAAALPGAV